MLYNKLNMNDLPAPFEGADKQIGEETPQATIEKEATVAPPESRGPEQAENPPSEDKLKDLPKEAKETGAKMAEELTQPQSLEVAADTQAGVDQGQTVEGVVSPHTSKALVWARRRELVLLPARH